MPEMLGSVSAKGQITIPVEVRRMLGVKPKDKVAFIVDDGEVRIRRAPSPLMDSYQAVPALKQPLTVEEMIAIAREEHAQKVAREGL